MASRPILYVTDTHSLVWYLSASPRLSPHAKAAFEQAEAGQAKILIPIIVIAELIFIIERKRIAADIERILGEITTRANYEITPLGLEQMACLRREVAIPEMHDRLIVCEALLHGAKVITEDEAIKQAGLVEVVW